MILGIRAMMTRRNNLPERGIEAKSRMTPVPPLLFSTEFIIESLDVIFFNIISVLDFNDLEWDDPRGFQTVFHRDGNKCAFIGMDIKNLFSLRHPRVSRNDHPVFTSMMMILKALL